MKNVKKKIEDIVEISLKPNLQSVFNVVGSEIYNKVSNRTSINNISYLSKNLIFFQFRKK